MSESQDPLLEEKLCALYRRYEPNAVNSAADRIASAIAAERTGKAGRRPTPRLDLQFLARRLWRPASATALIVAIALLIVVPLMLPASTPVSTPTSSPLPTVSASPAASMTAAPTASASAKASATPVPDIILAKTAAVDDAGPIRTGGMWAVSGTTLWLSFDGGSTWSSTYIPPRDPDALVLATAVLDAQHAWTLRAGPGSTTGNSDSVVSLLVYRTSDGGHSWQSTGIPGNFFDHFFDLTFVDPDHGFLEVYGSDGTNVVIYRTSDGGATWTAAPAHQLDWTISISDASTLWTSWPGPSAIPASTDQSMLEVSRNAGETWSTAPLPGFESQLTTNLRGVAAPPSFVDASTGYVAVNVAKTDPSVDGTSEIFRTTDGGTTWTHVSTAPYWLGNLVAIDASHLFAIAGFIQNDEATPNAEPALATLASADSGKTWRVSGEMPVFAGGSCWFLDPDHGAGVLMPGKFGYPDKVLYVTSNGGLTWQYANVGG